MFSGGWKKVKKDLGIRRSIHLSYRGNGCKYTISLAFGQYRNLNSFANSLPYD
jgi:hypothetical protein